MSVVGRRPADVMCDPETPKKFQQFEDYGTTSKMPVPLFNYVLSEGVDQELILSYAWPILKVASWLAALYLVKWYCGGTVNTSERNMHGKVVMITVCILSVRNNLIFTHI